MGWWKPALKETYMLSDEQMERLIELFIMSSEKQQEEILDAICLHYLTQTSKFLDEDEDENENWGAMVAAIFNLIAVANNRKDSNRLLTSVG